MATLQELHPMIDAGREAVLFLSGDNPLNLEQRDLKIFITKVSDGQYSRKLTFVEDIWYSPKSKFFTWSQLVDEEASPLEAKSDQWTLEA